MEDYNFILDRLVNYGQAAEGSLLPPVLAGPYRIPFVTNLRAAKAELFSGGALFTLTWEEPDEISSISHFIVYAVGYVNGQPQPLGTYTAVRSPAKIKIQAEINTPVTFYVQTVLASGLQSDLLSSPTVTASVAQYTIATVTPYQPASIATATINLAVSGTTTLINHIGKGLLISLGVRGEGAFAKKNPALTALLKFSISIDGSPAQDLIFVNQTANYSGETYFDSALFPVATALEKNPSFVYMVSAGNMVNIQLNIPYETSLVISFTNSGYTSGSVKVSVLRGNKL